MRTAAPFAIIAAASISIGVGAADWPQWRGPARDGIGKETGLLAQWPKDGPPLVWQLTDIGDGYAAPAVVGDRIYILSSRGVDNEFVQALSVQDGKVLWTTRLGKVGDPEQMPSFPKARSTPTIDGDALFAMSSDADVACLDLASGKLRWLRSLRNDFGARSSGWGFAESPLVDGDAVIVTPGGREAAVVGLNRKTGTMMWKTSVPEIEGAGYSSIMRAEVGGRRVYVQILATTVIGVDASDGHLLWRDKRGGQTPAMASPVVYRDLVYFATQGIGGGLIRMRPSGAGVSAEIAYFVRDLPNRIGGSVLVNGYLYGTNGNGLVAVEFATGRPQWQAESIGPASIAAADGRLYLHGEDNAVALVDAAPDAYRERGRFTVPSPPAHSDTMEKAWTYPVVANGRLYIRDRATLWSYDVKAGR